MERLVPHNVELGADWELDESGSETAITSPTRESSGLRSFDRSPLCLYRSETWLTKIISETALSCEMRNNVRET